MGAGRKIILLDALHGVNKCRQGMPAVDRLKGMVVDRLQAQLNVHIKVALFAKLGQCFPNKQDGPSPDGWIR